MKTEWLGRYRPLVESIIFFANDYASTYNREFVRTENGTVSYEQIQVVEYLLENEELQLNMRGVADRLGKSPSAFTKLVNKLVGKGLLEKYHAPDNKKNVIVLVSDRGRKVYDEYVTKYAIPIFQEFFDFGDSLSEEELEAVRVLLRKIDLQYSQKKNDADEASEQTPKDLRDTLIKIES
ncbi:MAG: MarR family transcriptional regulator [Clostridia bacterium]|nr:MarR family transcriptional regulator [Clostridia bacterium]